MACCPPGSFPTRLKPWSVTVPSTGRTCSRSDCRTRAGRPAPRPLPPLPRAADAASVPSRRCARRCRPGSLRASAPIAAAEGWAARLLARRRPDSAVSSGSDCTRRRSALRLLPLMTVPLPQNPAAVAPSAWKSLAGPARRTLAASHEQLGGCTVAF